MLKLRTHLLTQEEHLMSEFEGFAQWQRDTSGKTLVSRIWTTTEIHISSSHIMKMLYCRNEHAEESHQIIIVICIYIYAYEKIHIETFYFLPSGSY